MFNLKPRFALLGNSFFSYVKPQPLTNSYLLHINRRLQQVLNLNTYHDQFLKEIIAGEKTFDEYLPLASVYAGHQFGVPVPQLGDGRAMLIAEYQDQPEGTIWEFQLKGAGLTPYSRMGDGRAVLRSTIREYIASCAMERLGIPTTLALGIVGSDAPVYREQVETGAIILRVAESFIRFGHFEFFAKHKMTVELKQLADFVISNYFPQIDLSSSDYLGEFLQQVVILTAHLVAQWQSIGFVHGVMNTDNMSILGLTIDYGPYAFIDKFMPEHVYNHSDSEGRYIYARQVHIAWWNLYRLAEALVIIYPETDKLEQILATYADHYNIKFSELMGKKLGFPNLGVDELVISEQLFEILKQYQMDWTYTWRQLSYGESGKELLIKIYSLGDDFKHWYQSWQDLLALKDISWDDASKLMQQNNPAIVPRNHLLQEVIAQVERGNVTALDNMVAALSSPYSEDEKFNDYYKLPPSWAEHINLSCSS